MSFVEMTNEEWEEVRRHHDQLVHMAELELQVESLSPHSLKPVELQLQELDEVFANIQR